MSQIVCDPWGLFTTHSYMPKRCMYIDTVHRTIFPCFPYVIRIRTVATVVPRFLYLAIESRSAWDHTFRFPAILLEESKFWFNNIESLLVTPCGLALIRPLLFSPTRAMQLSEAVSPPLTALLPAVCSRSTIWVKVLLS